MPSTMGMMRTFGCTMMRYEVADATTIIRIENQTVAQRTARRLCSAVDRGLMYGSYQSRVKLVASAFIAVLSEPMAGAKISAIKSPRRATGIWYKMKWQNGSPDGLGKVGSGWAWELNPN